MGKEIKQQIEENLIYDGISKAKLDSIVKSLYSNEEASGMYVTKEGLRLLLLNFNITQESIDDWLESIDIPDDNLLYIDKNNLLTIIE